MGKRTKGGPTYWRRRLGIIDRYGTNPVVVYHSPLFGERHFRRDNGRYYGSISDFAEWWSTCAMCGKEFGRELSLDPDNISDYFTYCTCEDCAFSRKEKGLLSMTSRWTPRKIPKIIQQIKDARCSGSGPMVAYA